MADLPGPFHVHLFTARLSAVREDSEEPGLPGRLRARRSERLLRRLLSQVTGLSPARIPIETNSWGKPLLPESFGLWFSLSHSCDLLLAAVARFPIGVDLEADLPRKDPLRLARRFLLPEEGAAVAASPPEKRASAFLRIWIKKEAFLKGCGMGLFRSPRSFGFAAREGSSWERVDPPEPDGAVWAVRSGSCEDGFLCALAVAHAEPERLVVIRSELSSGESGV